MDELTKALEAISDIRPRKLKKICAFTLHRKVKAA